MVTKLALAPTVNYVDVNRCVYCGDASARLTNEHIIPRGLNGNLVLPKASCDACAKITPDIERRVLRGFLENGRRAIGISSRHKKHATPDSTPTTFIGANESTWKKNVPLADGLHVMHLPVFIRPLCLGGVSRDGNPGTLEIFALDTLHIGNTAVVAREKGATGIRFHTRIDGLAFVRMLGKIAHCYYIAERGWFPLEESPVLSLVRGESVLAKEWVGCLEDAPLIKPESKALHLIDITDLAGDDGSVCSVVRIKFFSTTSGPTYAVATRIR